MSQVVKGAMELNTEAMERLTVEIIKLQDLLKANNIPFNAALTSGDTSGNITSEKVENTAANTGKKSSTKTSKKSDAAKPQHTVAEAQAAGRELGKHPNGGAEVARSTLDSIGFSGKLSELTEEFADKAFDAFTAKLKEVSAEKTEEVNEDF